jgi:hypothetical protein
MLQFIATFQFSSNHLVFTSFQDRCLKVIGIFTEKFDVQNICQGEKPRATMLYHQHSKSSRTKVVIMQIMLKWKVCQTLRNCIHKVRQ